MDGLTRRCASQEGNALAVCCRLGLAGDPRASEAARPRPARGRRLGRGGPSEMLTLNALRVLHAAGR